MIHFTNFTFKIYMHIVNGLKVVKMIEDYTDAVMHTRILQAKRI